MPKARLTYKTNKDDGLIALSVDGVFLTECAYDGEPEEAYEWCKKLFNAGRTLPVIKDKQQEEIKELKAMLLFLVNNDSINDSSIEKEVVALLKL